MRVERISFPAPDPKADCQRIVIAIDPVEIGYAVMVIESYGHLAIPRTIDQARGIMELLTPPDLVDEVRTLIDALAAEIDVDIIKG